MMKQSFCAIVTNAQLQFPNMQTCPANLCKMTFTAYKKEYKSYLRKVFTEFLLQLVQKPGAGTF